MSQSTHRPAPSDLSEPPLAGAAEKIIVVHPLPEYVRRERTLRTTKDQPLAEYFADDVRRWRAVVADWFLTRK